jgi:hypothetical protein
MDALMDALDAGTEFTLRQALYLISCEQGVISHFLDTQGWILEYVEFEPSTAELDTQISTAVSRISKLEGMSDEEAEQEAGRDYECGRAESHEEHELEVLRQGRYERLRSQFESWPAKGDFAEIRDQMLSRLENAVFKVGILSYPSKQTGAAWRSCEISSLQAELLELYAKREEEVGITNRLNEQFRLLRESLADM